ncbi:hypothetical protein MNBD_GAMMA03-876 [hydrothermal vent metagenome]|uniref:Uncharacterized protein n=1 Tax=hydrothermal vent metagenome TaxID=652676 RepID=A0A3B0VWT7_9ZZZZ
MKKYAKICFAVKTNTYAPFIHECLTLKVTTQPTPKRRNSVLKNGHLSPVNSYFFVDKKRGCNCTPIKK